MSSSPQICRGCHLWIPGRSRKSKSGNDKKSRQIVGVGDCVKVSVRGTNYGHLQEEKQDQLTGDFKLGQPLTHSLTLLLPINLKRQEMRKRKEMCLREVQITGGGFSQVNRLFSFIGHQPKQIDCGLK